MGTTFERLNLNWNADSVDPEGNLSLAGTLLTYEFTLNHMVYTHFKEGQRARLSFHNCSRYRLGETNDEGWYYGQCRFSGSAPEWGEFYRLTGDSKFAESPSDWIVVPQGTGSQHFLFYMKDETFECIADSVEWSVVEK